MEHENNAVVEMVYAAMHAGNTGRARELLEQVQENAPEIAREIRINVTQQFGVML